MHEGVDSEDGGVEMTSRPVRSRCPTGVVVGYGSRHEPQSVETLHGYDGLVIPLSPPLGSSDTSALLLVPHRGRVQSAIEEAIEQV